MGGPLHPDTGSRSARVTRRARGITLEIVAFVLITVLFPVLLLGAALTDLTLWVLRRKAWVGIRLVTFAWLFLVNEMHGIATLGYISLRSLGRDTEWRRDAVFRLRWRWAAMHLGCVRKLFGLTFVVEGLDEAATGPEIIFIRHASIIDNMVPDALVGKTHRIGLRYVLKRELQMIPTIDIGGRMVPTNFVRRGSGDTDRELADLRRLAIDLGPGEGILIYPEGTRFTPEKLKRAQEKIAERQPDVAPLANRLNNLLPPRLGGPIALLQDAPEADVVICGHVGLDGFEYISDIWAGGLVGTTIRIRFWRHPAASVPREHDAQVAWLYDRWQELDDWIGAHATEEQRAQPAS